MASTTRGRGGGLAFLFDLWYFWMMILWWARLFYFLSNILTRSDGNRIICVLMLLPNIYGWNPCENRLIKIKKSVSELIYFFLLLRFLLVTKEGKKQNILIPRDPRKCS